MTGKPTDAPTIEGKICSDHNLSKSIIYTSFTVKRKLEVFNAYYYKLMCLDFGALSDNLIDAGILNSKDFESTKVKSCALEAINTSLQHGEDEMFDKFLLILRFSDCSICSSLAKEMERKGTARIIVVHFLHFYITHQLTT